MSTRAARAWHLLTCVVAVVALAYQLLLVVEGKAVLVEHAAPGKAEQVRRYFSYFTIESNAIDAWSAFAAATRDVAASRLQRVLRLDAVIGITVTGVVHFIALRPLLDLTGGSYVVDKLLHVVVPLLAVIGWVAFGPRGAVARADLAPALIWPLAWLAYTLLQGPVSHWYPYPFVDVSVHGLGVVLLNCAVVAVLFLGLAALLLWADRRLARKPDDRAMPAT